jgi:hypothetical protein
MPMALFDMVSGAEMKEEKIRGYMLQCIIGLSRWGEVHGGFI